MEGAWKVERYQPEVSLGVGKRGAELPGGHGDSWADFTDVTTSLASASEMDQKMLLLRPFS